MDSHSNDRRYGCLATLALIVLGIGVSAGATGEDWAAMRERMVQEIIREAYTTRHYVGKGEIAPTVIEAVRRVPRHEFVPKPYQGDSYLNQPLPIGKGQTISQPFIVALMTDLLEPAPGDKVLELGTGSGYQAAVLAEIVREVYTIEIVESLGLEAEERLRRLGYRNVRTRIGDGVYGWPEHAPFDGVIVTAAGVEIPEALIEQLKPGGKLVIPVGEQHETQHLMVLTKEPNGEITQKNVLPVRFVPITGDH